MKKFTFSLKTGVSVLLYVLCLSFSPFGEVEQEAADVQQSLTEHYNEASVGNIKKYELHITDKGFCRYKRFFNTGKVEYFSCNLQKLKTLDYLGTTKTGMLLLRTRAEDVIVQTYNDRHGGDVDSMATFIAIPLKNLEAEDLNALSVKFQQLQLKLRQP
jgi:hypothetical protein